MDVASESNGQTNGGVLLLIDCYRNPYAGTEHQLYNLASSLVARGIACHLVVLAPSDYLRKRGFPCDWSVVGHTSLRSPGTWYELYRVSKRFRERGYRVAQTFFNDVSIVAPPVLALAGVKTIVSRRDMGFWYTSSKRCLLRLTRIGVARWIANSHAVAAVTEANEWAPRESIQVIYNGVEKPDDVSTVPEDLGRLRQEGRLLAGLVANVRAIKRIPDLLESLERIKDEVPSLDVVIIGDGDQESLRAEASARGIGERVHCLGRRDDVNDCLAGLDMGVLCSASEGFSNAVVEYMLAGLPVICTDAGGNPEAVEHGHTGLLYPVGDTAKLADALRQLATDSHYRRRLGRSARQLALARFSVESMTDAHIRLYSELDEGFHP